ncbi:MAG: hypothetical protein JNM66_29125 [Bryobacterales bacterium]|nr:hypothetical protein [Bryobacterales bacterium]
MEPAKRDLLLLEKSNPIRKWKQCCSARRDWPTDGRKEILSLKAALDDDKLRALGLPLAAVGEWMRLATGATPLTGYGHGIPFA